jgi:hypothetical protein
MTFASAQVQRADPKLLIPNVDATGWGGEGRTE